MTVESDNSKPDLNNSEQEDIDKKLGEKIDELEGMVLSLAENAHKVEPAEKREDFKKEVHLQISWLLVAENSLLGGWSLSHYSNRHDCKGLAPKRIPTHAVWHCHGARVALLRCPIPRESHGIVPYYAGGPKR